MKLIDQVCSLELSMRLKELGVKQSSLFCWSEAPSLKKSEYWRIYYKGTNEIHSELDYSAFTIAELGEMLPDWSESRKRAHQDWTCTVRDKNSDKNWHSFSESEANARAKMLIYLLENKLIGIPEEIKEATKKGMEQYSNTIKNLADR